MKKYIFSLFSPYNIPSHAKKISYFTSKSGLINTEVDKITCECKAINDSRDICKHSQTKSNLKLGKVSYLCKMVLLLRMVLQPFFSLEWAPPVYCLQKEQQDQTPHVETLHWEMTLMTIQDYLISIGKTLLLGIFTKTIITMPYKRLNPYTPAVEITAGDR